MSEIVLKSCARLSARITDKQCERNRKGYKSGSLTVPGLETCVGCPGLGRSGEIIQREVAVAKIECKKYGCHVAVAKKGDFCSDHVGAKKQTGGKTVQPSRVSIDQATPAEWDSAAASVKQPKGLAKLLAPPTFPQRLYHSPFPLRDRAVVRTRNQRRGHCCPGAVASRRQTGATRH